MTKADAVRFVLIRSLGNFLVLFALYGVFATFGPVVAAEVQYRVAQARGVEFVVREKVQEPKNTSSRFAEVLAGNKEQILIPKDTQFSILIPKIGATAKVFSNVDPANEKEFLSVLQQGVAHAEGSVFPGTPGNTYLFAHSTDTWWHVERYNAVFYLLKELEAGDDVVIFFKEARYDYVVTEKKVLDATDVSLLVDGQREKEQLILQTCWPPGTTWKRLFIVAIPKG